MIDFQQLSVNEFLRDYWQKKPVVLRNALPNFINPITPDELAGLALEDDVESRIVKETPKASPQWHLERGPFAEEHFTSLPKTHWTLLVQGVDRIVPEVYALLDHFNFIPQWRIDDVMISYASQFGSVGPHYDHYDVFLFQAMGRREWSLTSQGCTPENYIPELELRIMRDFATEQQFVLEEGDMLYLPPHIGHYGISLSKDCMTYSFGYRSYTGQELLDSLGDYLSEKGLFKTLYKDPDWSNLNNTSELQAPAWQQAQQLLGQLVNNESLIKSWFARFATCLDHQAEQQLPTPNADNEVDLGIFLEELEDSIALSRDACCRFVYTTTNGLPDNLYINGELWGCPEVSPDLIALVANNRFISKAALTPFLDNEHNLLFLFELWNLNWLYLDAE